MEKTYKKASQMTAETNRSNFNVPGEKSATDMKFPLSEIPFDMGMATPTTNPGVPDGKSNWTAVEAGVYTFFLDSSGSAIEVFDGELCSLKFINGVFTKEIIVSRLTQVTDVATSASFINKNKSFGGGTSTLWVTDEAQFLRDASEDEKRIGIEKVVSIGVGESSGYERSVFVKHKFDTNPIGRNVQIGYFVKADDYSLLNGYNRVVWYDKDDVFTGADNGEMRTFKINDTTTFVTITVVATNCVADGYAVIGNNFGKIYSGAFEVYGFYYIDSFDSIATTSLLMSAFKNNDGILLKESLVSQVGESEEMAISQKIFTNELYGSTTFEQKLGSLLPNYNSMVLSGGWLELIPVTADGIVKSISIPSLSEAISSATVVVASSESNTIYSVKEVSLLAYKTDLTSYNIEVKKGDYVGVEFDGIESFMKYYRYDGPGVATFSQTPVVGESLDVNPAASTFGVNLCFDIAYSGYISRIMKKELLHSDAQSLIITGSSLTESAYALNGMAWSQRINDIIDIPIVNAAKGGMDVAYNMWMIGNDISLPHDTGNNVRDCNPAYILWQNCANGTLSGLPGIDQLTGAKEVTNQVGAKMLIGTEENWRTYWASHYYKNQSFAQKELIPYSLISQLFIKAYPAEYTYDGFVYLGHCGWRSQATYWEHYENMLRFLEVKETIKLYRVRPTYKEGSPVVADLSYKDSIQRFQKYVAISSGNGTYDPLMSTAGIDNMDNHNYDVQGGTNNGIADSETSMFIRGANIDFNDYALVECLLREVKIGTFTITTNCTIEPSGVYVRKIDADNVAEDAYTSPACTFQAVAYKWNDGILELEGTGEMQSYDKVTILINCSGSFAVGGTKVEWTGGVDKDVAQPKSLIRKRGVELLSSTAAVLNWALSSTAIRTQFPDEIAQYPDYNAEKRHIELRDDDAYMTLDVPLSEPCNFVVIRIVAQTFYKIATTRYNGDAEMLASGYIDNSKPQIKEYDYDYGHLQLRVNDSLFYERIVMQGWHEIYIEVPLMEGENELRLKLLRQSFVDSSYSNADQPILINDISVQRIS